MSSKQAGRKAWGGGGKRRVVSRSLTSSRSTSTTSVQKFSSSDTDLDLVDVDDDVDIGLLAELSAELPLTSKTYGGGMQGAAARQRAFRRKKQEEQHARLDAQRKRNSVVPQRTASSVLRKKLASGKTAIGWAAKLKEAHLDRKKRVLSPRQQAARRQEAAAVERNKARPPRSIKLSGNGGGLLYKLIRCTDYHQLFLRLGIDFWSLVALRFDFDRIDADRTLTIDIEEFLQHFQFTFKTPLIQKVFGAFDLNGSRDLDFAEFVVCTWNYGSCSAAELNAYFFDMYDPQHKGVLQEKTLLQMVSDAYGHHNMAKTCQAALERAGFMKQVSRAPGVRGVTMTRTEFVTFAGKNPALFFPMATLQRQVCAKIGPKGFWKKQIKARGKAFQPFRPALWDLQRLFQPKDYLERASLTVHGASDLSLRGSSREPPSVFCKVYCCTVPSKSEASHICWDTVMPQFAKTIDFIGVHLNDRIRVEIWDWPHPRSLVRPAGMCQLLGSVELPLRELDKEAGGGGKPVSKDLPLVLVPRPDSGTTLERNLCSNLSRKDEAQQPTVHISIRVTRRGDAAKEHTFKQQAAHRRSGSGMDGFVTDYLDEEFDGPGPDDLAWMSTGSGAASKSRGKGLSKTW